MKAAPMIDTVQGSIIGKVINSCSITPGERIRIYAVHIVNHRKRPMKPSEALKQHRDHIREIVARNDARNPRVFGSALHGEDTENSDLDILVDPVEGKTTLISLVRIKRELERVLGVKADVLTPMSLHDRFRQDVLREAVSI